MSAEMKTETRINGDATLTLGEAIDHLQSIVDSPAHSRDDEFAMCAYVGKSDWWIVVTRVHEVRP